MVPISLLAGYFTIGLASALPSLGATYIMVETLNMNASDIANVAIVCSIPWCLKPLIAAISDSTWCCCGYRRRPYVSLFSLLCGMIMLVTPRFSRDTDDPTNFVACLALTSFCICVVDVCLDGSLMVLVAKERDSGSEGVAQGHAWAARVAGATIGAGWGGKVYTFSFTTLMILSSVLPLAMSVVAFDIPDEPASEESRKKSRGERVSEYNSRYRCTVVTTVVRTLWACRFVLGAAVLVAIVPEFNTGLFFYMLGGGMKPQALSMVEVAGSMASLGALFIYNASRPSHQLSFALGILLGTLAALVGTLMANDSVPWLLEAAAVEAIIASTSSILCLMPTITVIGAYAARTKVESTVYSTGLSILNLSGVLSEAIASRSMAAFDISKHDVNSVRIFVGCVAILSLMTLPSALCFPRRNSLKVVRMQGFAHPGMKETDYKDYKRRRQRQHDNKFTLETSDSSDSGNANSSDEKEVQPDGNDASPALSESGDEEKVLYVAQSV